MDGRKGGGAVTPKVRKVGFVTASDGQDCPTLDEVLPSRSDMSPPTVNTLSPVMIPPSRHGAEGARASPVPVPSPPRRRLSSEMAVGSYKPPDYLLSSSPLLSPSSRTESVTIEFSQEPSPSWVAKTLSVGVGKMDELLGKRPASLPADVFAKPPNLVPNSVPKQNPGVQDTNQGMPANSKPLKEKISKAERRALQEAQRATKAAAKETGGSKPAPPSGGGFPAAEKSKYVKPSPTPRKKDGSSVSCPATGSERKTTEWIPDKEKKKDAPSIRMQYDDTQRVEKAKKRALVKQTESKNRVELFRHLPQYVHGTQLPDLESKFFNSGHGHQMHPHRAVYKVGLQYLSGDISGGNARCTAMLLAFREVIKDYTTPSEKALVRDLTAKINSYVGFLISCRPLSVSMGNAIRFLKDRISKLSLTLTESETKAALQSDIDRFINEKIILADKVIVGHAVTKIRDGDVLLTYGAACVVEMIFCCAHELGKKFRVVVVDSHPKLEGQKVLKRLLLRGIPCTYIHINAISYVMHEATKVFVGAASVLSNGTVYSRVGTACVAMMAHSFRVPVLICCEAYKFHERVQLDSICSNELGDPDSISKVSGRKGLNHLENWADYERLHLLNLIYDITPADYVSMLITDYGMVPPTSVPVIVREYGGSRALI